MRNINFKNLSVLVFIDFIALSLFYFFTRYVIQTVRNYYQIIQGLTPQIDQTGLVLQQNSSLFDMNSLGSNLDTISLLSNKIIFLFFLLALFSFLIYNISQSINWNLALNEFKLKNYRSYLKKFTIINIPAFFILTYLVFKIIVRLKDFILKYWFGSFFNTKEFFIIFFLGLIFIIIIYFKFYLYKSINKLSLIDSLYLLKKRFYNEYFNFVLLALTIFLSIFLFIIILRINPESSITGIIASLASLIVFNLFRTYFTNN